MKPFILALAGILSLLPAAQLSAEDTPVSGSAIFNPKPDACCECFGITILGVNPGESFQVDKDKSLTSYVRVAKKSPSSGVECLDPLKITVGARLLSKGRVVPNTTQSREVTVGAGTDVVVFTLTADQARLGDEWQFGSVCAGKSDESGEGKSGKGTEILGCSRIEIPLSTCDECIKFCKYVADPSARSGVTGPFSPPGTAGGFIANIPTMGADGGQTKGSLSYYAEDFANPGREALLATIPTDFTVTRAGGFISSVQTGASSIEVAPADAALLSLDPNAFVVTHKDAGGVVFRITTISFVTEAGVPRLRMDTTFDGSTTRTEQTQPAPDTLVLEEGRVVAGTFQALSRETVVKTEPFPGKRVQRRTLQERATASAAWSATSDAETTWEKLIHGWVQTREVIDPSGAALTSTWAYYQPGENTGPGASTEGLGHLKHHVRYDGYESFHTYSLNRSTVTTPYADSVAGRVDASTWDPVSMTDTTTTTVNGIVVSKSISVHTPTTETNTVYTSAGATLATVTHYIPSDAAEFGGSPNRTTNPDGTITTYAYTRNAGSGYTTVTEDGSTINGTTVAKGTRTTTTTNSHGTTILSKTEAIGYGTGSAVFSSMAVTSVDSLGRALSTAYFPASATVTGEVASAVGAKWITTTEYSCCGVSKETDMYGIPTYYAYDHLQNQIKTNRLGVTMETVRNGLTTDTHRYAESVSGGLSSTLIGTAADLFSRSVSNLSGTLQESWSPDPTSATPGALVKSSSTATNYQPAVGLSMRISTITPDNFSQISDSYLDGRTFKTYGDLSPAMQYAYSVNSTGEVNSQSYLDGASLRETTTTQFDWAGREIRMDYLDGSFSTIEYNALGQVVRSTDPDGVNTLMAYNAEGEPTISASDLNSNGVIDYGTDTVSSSDTDPALDGSSNPVFLTVSKVWQNGDTNPTGGTTVSTSSRSPDGLSLSSQSIGIVNPSTSLTILSGDGDWTTTSTAPDATYTVITYTDGLIDITEDFDSADTLISSNSIRNATNTPLSGYDSLNRTIHQRDSRIGVSTTTYLSATSDVVASVTDPGARNTAYKYDVRGRWIERDAPDTAIAGGTSSNVTTTSYFPDDSIQETTGDQTYRTTYTYDYADRQLTLTTFGGTTATSSWEYSPTRGFLTRKKYADGKGTDYTYTSAGRLSTRNWERGVTTEYTYDAGGRGISVDYSDSTPDVITDYDALGRPTFVRNGNGTIVGGELTIANPLSSNAYTYNPVTLVTDNEIITYDIDTDGTPELTRTIDRSHDNLARPDGYQLKDGAVVESSTSYGFDITGRLKRIAPSFPLPASSAFKYTYVANTYGLLTSVTGPAHTVENTWENGRNVLLLKVNHTGTPSNVVSKYDYALTSNATAGANEIGQRTNLATTGSGFDGSSFGSATATGPSLGWSYNNKGEVVEANDSSVANNDRAYQYDGVGNREKATEGLLSALPGSNNYTANALNQYTAVESLVPSYDNDGNATSYPMPAYPSGNSTLAWDGENRLISATINSVTTNYLYDSQSRRFAVSTGTTTTLTVYDGWNPIAKYSGATLVETYLWGMDLSGSIQGAGGVGGLLLVTDHLAPGTPSYYPTYDGNGNVSEYLDSTGAVVAHYEYDPFGNTTVATGMKANDFSHRFSTKPIDVETGLYYYGFRYYDPQTGRWPSRDPLAESGGVNLYGFAGNDGVNAADVLGLKWMILGREKVSSISTIVTDGSGGLEVYLKTQDSPCAYFAVLIHEMVHLTEALKQDPGIGKIKPDLIAKGGETRQVYFQYEGGKLKLKVYNSASPNWPRNIQVENTNLHELYQSEIAAYKKQKTAADNLNKWIKVQDDNPKIDELLKGLFSDALLKKHSKNWDGVGGIKGDLIEMKKKAGKTWDGRICFQACAASAATAVAEQKRHEELLKNTPKDSINGVYTNYINSRNALVKALGAEFK